MKTSSSDLFNLIKSMTKSEKGYFKKHSGLATGEKIYLKLFDAIDSQKQYDEAKIKDKFKSEQFIKQVSVAKNNLYRQILKSLNQSSISSNNRFELRTNVTDAEILFNKGLIRQALKMIEKLKSQAYEIEELDILLQLISLQKTIMLKSFIENQKELDDLYTEELDTLQKRNNVIHYQKLHNKSYYTVTKYGHIRSKSDEKRFEAILNTEFMKNPALADSTVSKIYYSEIFFHYNVSALNFKEALKSTTRMLELVEKNRKFLESHVDKYLSIFQNHVLQYFYLNRFDETESNAQKLIALLDNKKLKISERAKITCIGKLLCIRIAAFINSVDFNSCAKILNEINEFISSYNDITDNSIKIVLFNHAAYYKFIIGDYTGALSWINRLLNDPQMKYFVEILCNAKWFELLIHFELKNYDYIDNALKTNQRYLDRNEKILGIEKLMIKFFTKALNSPDPVDKKLFEDLSAGLNKLVSANHEIDYYNVRAWSASKSKGMQLREYLESNSANA